MNEVTFKRKTNKSTLQKGHYYYNEDDGLVYIIIVKGISYVLVCLNDGSWYSETAKSNPSPDFLNGFTRIEGEITIVTE